MRRRSFLLAMAVATLTAPAHGAGAADFAFPSIDGGTLRLADFRGGPLLVVNTASRCSFTPQYDALQALYERYRDRGLTVLGVPSDSFRQELADAGAVKDFCDVNFGIDFPMTAIAPVQGPQAHPFYRWAAAQGAEPRWNFHKILLDADGRLAGDFATRIEPDALILTAAIEALLPSG